MKKLIYSAVISLCFGMTGCQRTQHAEDPDYGQLHARVQFDPVAAKLVSQSDPQEALKYLPLYNNLYLRDRDGTLNLGEAEQGQHLKASYASTASGVNAIDGWSLRPKIEIYFKVPKGMEIDVDTLNGKSVKLFEVASDGHPFAHPLMIQPNTALKAWRYDIAESLTAAPEDNDAGALFYHVEYIPASQKIIIRTSVPFARTRYLVV